MAQMQIDGVELHYDDIGTGPPVLLIHGNGATATHWGDTASTLAAARRVITYDRRGFGRSTHLPVKSFQRHTADAAALLDELAAGPANVVGWSGGGIIALDLAVHRPDLVAALVLEEPPLHAKRHMRLRMARSMLKAQVLRRTSGPERGAEVFFRWASGYTSGGSAFDRFPADWQHALRSNGLATMVELDAGTGEYLKHRHLASIACPVTCLVGGLSDPVFAAATRRIAGSVPQAETIIIEGASHALHFDRPDEFVAAISTVTTSLS